MCVGPLAPPRPPKPPTPQGPAHTVKAAAKGPEFVDPEKIKDESDSEDLIDTKKKKALEIQKRSEERRVG